MDKILEKSVKNLFLGLIAGDGDVFSRMASSHEGASPAYPEPLAGIVSAIKIDFDQGKFAKLQSDEDFDEAIKPYFESFAQTYSPENFPTEPENNAPAGDVRFAARYLARSIGLTWIGNRSFYRAKNCKKGIACGNTCIAKNRVCKQNLSPAVATQVPPAKAKTKKAAGGATTAPAAPAAPSAPAPAPATPTPEFVPKGIYTQAEYNSLDTEHKKRLFRIAAGLEDDRPLSEQKSGDRVLLYFNKTTAQKSKVFNVLDDNPNLTQAEADAIAHWINHEYQTVNKSIYAPNSLSPKNKKIGEAGAIRTSQALRKMPPATDKEIRKIAKERGEPSELAKDKKLRRHIKGVPDLDAFLAPYEQAQKSGKPHLEPTVFATTAKNNLDFFQSGAQATFVIKAKLDGTGSGRTVDQYKNEAWEGEVLYPSFTGFKVNKITRQQGEPVIIEMEEL